VLENPSRHFTPVVSSTTPSSLSTSFRRTSCSASAAPHHSMVRLTPYRNRKGRLTSRRPYCDYVRIRLAYPTAQPRSRAVSRVRWSPARGRSPQTSTLQFGPTAATYVLFASTLRDPGRNSSRIMVNRPGLG